MYNKLEEQEYASMLHCLRRESYRNSMSPDPLNNESFSNFKPHKNGNFVKCARFLRLFLALCILYRNLIVSLHKNIEIC